MELKCRLQDYGVNTMYFKGMYANYKRIVMYLI